MWSNLAGYSYHGASKLFTCLNFASFATLDVSLIIWPFSLDPSKTVSFFLFEIVVKSRWHWHWIETCIGRALKIGHTSRRSRGNSSTTSAVGHTFGHATPTQCNICSKWSCPMRYFQMPFLQRPRSVGWERHWIVNTREQILSAATYFEQSNWGSSRRKP